MTWILILIVAVEPTPGVQRLPATVHQVGPFESQELCENGAAKMTSTWRLSIKAECVETKAKAPKPKRTRTQTLESQCEEPGCAEWPQGMKTPGKSRWPPPMPDTEGAIFYDTTPGNYVKQVDGGWVKLVEEKP